MRSSQRAWPIRRKPYPRLTVRRACAALLALASALSHAAKAADAAPSTVRPAAAEPFAAEEFALGSATAPVTVIEYLSTTCVHCAAFDRQVWPRARVELVDSGRVRWLIREMPTAPVAVSTAEFLLARCLGAAGYWPGVERLIQQQARITGAAAASQAIDDAASILELSKSDADLCLSDPAQIDAANARRVAALAQGVDSTPFFIVNGVALRPGVRLAGRDYLGGELSWAQLQDAVSQAERTRAAAPPQRLLR